MPENTSIPGSEEDKEARLANESTSSSDVNPQIEVTNMEVHKHASHVTHKKKWSEYFLEFFMLFLAVFLGFIAENIREHIVEKNRARQYAKSLISDLRNDTAMINNHIWQIARMMRRIDTLSVYVSNKNLEQIDNFELLYKCVIFSYNPYTWNRATLEQIKSSGSLRYFDNDSIVKSISAYDAFTRHMDYDYEVDQNESNLISVRREQIIDMNYPASLWMSVGSKYDSLKNTPFYEELRNLNKPLLTTNINDIKILGNEAIQLKLQISIRRDFELPLLIKSATELIHLLETEYHLN